MANLKDLSVSISLLNESERIKMIRELRALRRMLNPKKEKKETKKTINTKQKINDNITKMTEQEKALLLEKLLKIKERKNGKS